MLKTNFKTHFINLGSFKWIPAEFFVKFHLFTLFNQRLIVFITFFCVLLTIDIFPIAYMSDSGDSVGDHFLECSSSRNETNTFEVASAAPSVPNASFEAGHIGSMSENIISNDLNASSSNEVNVTNPIPLSSFIPNHSGSEEMSDSVGGSSAFSRSNVDNVQTTQAAQTMPSTPSGLSTSSFIGDNFRNGINFTTDNSQNQAALRIPAANSPDAEVEAIMAAHDPTQTAGQRTSPECSTTPVTHCGEDATMNSGRSSSRLFDVNESNEQDTDNS